MARSAQGWAWRRRGSCKAPKRARCSCWTLDRICHERRALQHAARGRWQAAARQQHLNCSEQVLRLPRKAECSRQQHTLPAVQVKSKGDLPKPYSEIVEPYSGALGDGIEAGAAAHSPGASARRKAFWKRCRPARLAGAPSLKAASSWPYSNRQATRISSHVSQQHVAREAECRHALKLLAAAASGVQRSWRKTGQHVASSAALHGTTRSLPHCSFHRCHSPFDPPGVCLTCHWLNALWVLWVGA